jgi:hypothetical protein
VRDWTVRGRTLKLYEDPLGTFQAGNGATLWYHILRMIAHSIFVLLFSSTLALTLEVHVSLVRSCARVLMGACTIWCEGTVRWRSRAP